MRRLLLLIFCLINLAMVINSVAGAESLWTEQSRSLYSSQANNFHAGDLLTVMIVEQASATQQAKSSNGEKGSLGIGPGTGVLAQLLPLIGADWDSTYQGQGSTSRGGSLKAKLTVTITEVRENGILVLEGKQQIKVNNEDQLLKISGLARSVDVGLNNVILSSNIADAKIEYQGKGTIGETQQPGIFTRLVQWLF